MSSKLLEKLRTNPYHKLICMWAFIVIGRELWALLSGAKEADMRCLSLARPQEMGPSSPVERTWGRGRRSCWREALCGLCRPKRGSSGPMLAWSQGSERWSSPFPSGHSRAVRLEKMQDRELISWSLQLEGPAMGGASSHVPLLTDCVAGGRHPSYEWGLQTPVRSLERRHKRTLGAPIKYLQWSQKWLADVFYWDRERIRFFSMEVGVTFAV